MYHTMFDTPVINRLLFWVSTVFLKLFGWRVVGTLPDIPKFVMTAAPHTSNWDGVVMLTMAFVFRKKIFWVGKTTLFRWPFGWLVRWCGGIPVDRSDSGGHVKQTIAVFRKNKKMAIAIQPEGTRSKVRQWKTGFYYTALGADVPILLGFIDYKRKVGGVGPLIYPQGDVEDEIKAIRAFYNNISGKY